MKQKGKAACIHFLGDINNDIILYFIPFLYGWIYHGIRRRKKGEQGRILLIAGLYYPMVGGCVRVVEELAKRFDDMGYIVDILSCNASNSSQYESQGRINIIRLCSWNIVNSSFPIPMVNHGNYEILTTLSTRKYSVIITNTRFYPVCLIGWILSFLRSIPHIHLEHGSRHTVFENHIVAQLGRLYDHSVGSMLVKSADMNFGVSKTSVVFLKHLGAKKARVMHNGIALFPTQEIIGNSSEERSTVFITYVGRLAYAKGVQDLISIYPELGGNVRLTIVGDGPYRHELEEIAKQFPGANIEFIGEQRPEDIPSILRRADIFVNPSYSEGLPTSVLEACAAGCAVVATDVGGTSEIIQDGQTGLLVTPGNRGELVEKINYLIKNKEIREEIGVSARTYVMEKFSWDRIMVQWVDAINEVDGNLGSDSDTINETRIIV